RGDQSHTAASPAVWDALGSSECPVYQHLGATLQHRPSPGTGHPGPLHRPHRETKRNSRRRRERLATEPPALNETGA
ncbi:hypothetical protein, partial [Eisenbergiella tayi]